MVDISLLHTAPLRTSGPRHKIGKFLQHRRTRLTKTRTDGLSRIYHSPQGPGEFCNTRISASVLAPDSRSVCTSRLSSGFSILQHFRRNSVRRCLRFSKIRIQDTIYSRTAAAWKSFRALKLNFVPGSCQFRRPTPGRRYFRSLIASVSPALREVPKSNALESGTRRARASTCRSDAALCTRPGGRCEARLR